MLEQSLPLTPMRNRSDGRSDMYFEFFFSFYATRLFFLSSQELEGAIVENASFLLMRFTRPTGRLHCLTVFQPGAICFVAYDEKKRGRRKGVSFRVVEAR